MLAFLDSRGRARREELLSLLWGDMPEEKARNAFRQALHRLRGTLGDSGIIATTRDAVALHPESGLESDRRAFEQACDDGRFTAAVALYHGHFLEGFEAGEPVFDRWAEAERLKLRTRFETALRSAATEALDAGQLTDAVRHAQRLTESAPFDEQAAILEASILIAAGRSPEAISVLRRFTDRLREELDLEPPPGVKAMFARLNRAEATPPSTAAHADTPRPLPFVGREPELARLLGAINRLGAERGATLLVEGDEGSGKSRLLDEFLQRARTLGRLLVLRGRDRAFSSALPYASIAEALRPLSRAPGVAGASRHLLAEAARLLPELRDQFDLPAVPPVEDEPGRVRFFEGIAAAIDAAAYEQPVCIVLDDFQNASPSTADLVAYLSGRLRTSPVLLLISYRPDRVAAHLLERVRGFAGDSGVGDPRLSIGALPSEEAAALARAAVPRARKLDASEIEALAAAAGGLPGAIIAVARREEPTSGSRSALVSTRDVLWARLQTLSPAARRVFFAVSLLERPSSLRLLSAAAHLPESAAAAALESLVAADLVRDENEWFTLAHDASASFVNDAGGISGRAMLAGWAAEALSREPDATDEELTRLFALSGRPDSAYTHARRAAFHAASVGAWSEGAGFLNLALTFAPNDGARREVDALLAAFGRGPLRLAAGDEPPDFGGPELDDGAAAEPEAIPGVTAEANPVPESARPRRRSWIAATRNRREWLVAVVISAIVITLGVVGNRRFAASRITADVVDSLVVLERGPRGQSLNLVSGRVGGELDVTPVTSSWLPAWTGSMPAAWLDPVVSPDGRLVVLSHVTAHGKEVVVIGSDRRDTVTIATGGGDNAALDWSPDSRALLVSRARTLGDGSFHADLWIYRIGIKDSVPLDTTTARSVTAARWSPNGTRVAWVAQAGSSRAAQVFVSPPDGSDVETLSSGSGEDFDVAWSPDGSLLEFTSTRSGAARIYAYDFDNARVWPVTDRDGDSHALFSPDGRFIAFESTRDGDAAVYVTRSLGGAARRITPAGRQFSVVEWRGAPAPYVDRVRIIGPSVLSVGDTAQYSVLSVDQFGGPAPNVAPVLSVDLPPQMTRSASGSPTSVTLSATGAGRARLIASVPGWRSDTLDVIASPSGPVDFLDDFSGGLSRDRWSVLGSPLPYVGPSPSGSGNAVFPNSDLQWDSGILSRPTFDLRRPVVATARLHAPFGTRATQASTMMAFVEPIAADDTSATAPRVTPMVSVTWDGRSGAMRYAVGSQSFTDRDITAAGAHDVTIAIDVRGSVVFQMDGATRWTSSLRYLGDLATAPSQLWIGGHATGANVAYSRVAVRSGTP